MKLVNGRVVSFAMGASLVLAIGVVPCAAWMIGSQSGHECCDHSSEHSSDPKTACERLCAVTGSPFTVYQKQGVQKTELSAGHIVPVTASWAPVSAVGVGACVPLHPPDHRPPLYVLHAAFLV